MGEKEFWDIIRRALLMVVKAIEKRYGLEPSNSREKS